MMDCEGRKDGTGEEKVPDIKILANRVQRKHYIAGVVLLLT